MVRRRIGIALAAVAVSGFLGSRAEADDAQIARGKYLVSVISCGDCHTNGALIGKPDIEHYLGGSDIGFQIPGLGFFYGPNLTPDAETGLGSWSSEQIVAAITKGVRPDGRELAPIMPWRSFRNLTAEDASSVALYLKSLPPVKHKAPGPFGPSEKPSAPYMTVMMPAP
jgi:mono/diheme cytochrome c family protein